jgi:hypothetical protein
MDEININQMADQIKLKKNRIEPTDLLDLPQYNQNNILNAEIDELERGYNDPIVIDRSRYTPYFEGAQGEKEVLSLLKNKTMKVADMEKTANQSRAMIYKNLKAMKEKRLIEQVGHEYSIK